MRYGEIRNVEDIWKNWGGFCHPLFDADEYSLGHRNGDSKSIHCLVEFGEEIGAAFIGRRGGALKNVIPVFMVYTIASGTSFFN
mmetsp:Transcript_4929/g.7595  ORF Transcript_4929/g.7595 Transcript_4929/m.7595 type:complete len:84 (+) Transcript_4929:477-728(+)